MNISGEGINALARKIMPKNWPKYYHDRLYLGDRQSSTALVTLWTVKEKICAKLPRGSFCVSGQLYSKRGISFLLRNILANPSIRTVVVCGRDETKSGQALLAFAKRGIDARHRIVGFPNAVIDKELPTAALALVRTKIKFVDLIGEDDPNKIAKIIKKIKRQPPFGNPRLFPLPALPMPDKLPVESGMQVVRDSLVSTVWPDLLRRILLFGSESRHFHGSQVKEIFNFTAVVTDENPVKPKLIPEFGFAAAELKSYVKHFLSAAKGKEEYTYGSRMRNFRGVNQVDEMVRKIKGYTNDRGALSVLWDPATDNAPRKVPCLSLVQVNGEGDRLHLTAYFRSNDMFNAWPRNAFALRALQYEIAKKVGKKPGWLTTISNCAHIYENEWESARSVAQKFLDKKSFIPDVRGNILVSTKGEKILVKQVSQAGEDIREFEFDGQKKKAAWAAIQDLLKAEVFGNPHNAADIAIELRKAEEAIKRGKKYEQDQ